MSDRLIDWLHSISEWFDSKTARMSIRMGEPVPQDVIERRRKRAQHKRRW